MAQRPEPMFPAFAGGVLIVVGWVILVIAGDRMEYGLRSDSLAAMGEAATFSAVGWFFFLAAAVAFGVAGYMWHARMVGDEVARALAQREAPAASPPQPPSQ